MEQAVGEVQVDLGDVEESLLIVLTGERGVGGQHHVGQHPQAPTTGGQGI